jgi:hypothetical protein
MDITGKRVGHVSSETRKKVLGIAAALTTAVTVGMYFWVVSSKGLVGKVMDPTTDGELERDKNKNDVGADGDGDDDDDGDLDCDSSELEITDKYRELISRIAECGASERELMFKDAVYLLQVSESDSTNPAVLAVLNKAFRQSIKDNHELIEPSGESLVALLEFFSALYLLRKLPTCCRLPIVEHYYSSLLLFGCHKDGLSLLCRTLKYVSAAFESADADSQVSKAFDAIYFETLRDREGLLLASLDANSKVIGTLRF